MSFSDSCQEVPNDSMYEYTWWVEITPLEIYGLSFVTAPSPKFLVLEYFSGLIWENRWLISSILVGNSIVFVLVFNDQSF